MKRGLFAFMGVQRTEAVSSGSTFKVMGRLDAREIRIKQVPFDSNVRSS
jgi:hypothetical protein